MKPTAYLVNTARGPIVDEDALLEVLTAEEDRGRRHRRVLGRAAADGSPFRKLDNLVLTPHLGYVTEESFRAHYGQMVECIDAWFKGEPPGRWRESPWLVADLVPGLGERCTNAASRPISSPQFEPVPWHRSCTRPSCENCPPAGTDSSMRSTRRPSCCRPVPGKTQEAYHAVLCLRVRIVNNVRPGAGPAVATPMLESGG